MSVKFTITGPETVREKYVRAIWSFRDFYIRPYVGIRVRVRNWDDERGRTTGVVVNSKGWKSATVNRFLDAVENACSFYEGVLARSEEDMSETFDAIVAQCKEEVGLGKRDKRGANGTVKVRLLPAYKRFMAEEAVARDWAKSTRVNYNKLVGHLDGFDSKAFLQEVDLEWMEGFFAYLSRGMTEASVRNMFVNLMSFLRWAVKKYGIRDECLLFSYKTRQNYRDLMYLTVDELSALVSLQVPVPEGAGKKELKHVRELELVRDMFIFCCFTGLRFSDMQRLEWIHVYKDSIRMYTQKTMTPIEVGLNPIARKILNRFYGGEAKGYVFPRISNLAMNNLLKEIGNLLGLEGVSTALYFKNRERIETEKNRSNAITTHTGRHTFAVQALSAGVPHLVVMSYLGHSHFTSLAPYNDATSEARRQAMKKLEEYFSEAFRY